MTDFYDIEVETIRGDTERMRAYAGTALLIVNVASKCGFTPQYAALETLYRKSRDKGFAVLGFPCDQFGHQEPGDGQEIMNFCSLTYGVSFPMFAKIEVNGPGTHPLYRHLKSAAPGILGTTAIKWNFTKFLVDAEGAVRGRFGSMDKPESLASRIEGVLPRRP